MNTIWFCASALYIYIQSSKSNCSATMLICYTHDALVWHFTAKVVLMMKAADDRLASRTLMSIRRFTDISMWKLMILKYLQALLVTEYTKTTRPISGWKNVMMPRSHNADGTSGVKARRTSSTPAIILDNQTQLEEVLDSRALSDSMATRGIPAEFALLAPSA